ncbi:MAG: GIY-YIG nuclease family protein [Pseudomonadota bacterium]
MAWVYILTNRRNGTLYVGVTSNLSNRLNQHFGSRTGFTARYGLKRLVHAEVFDEIYDAIVREKQIKRWRRQKKIDLIERDNPDWDELLW